MYQTYKRSNTIPFSDLTRLLFLFVRGVAQQLIVDGVESARALASLEKAENFELKSKKV